MSFNSVSLIPSTVAGTEQPSINIGRMVILYWLHCLQIFSPILWVVFFFFLMVSFTVQKLLHLIRSHLVIFIILEGESKKDIAAIYVWECSACFPLRVPLRAS